MNTVRFASLVATFAFGLMGCATEGLGQAQTAGASSATASYDPSSFYQPSPNSRPLAVQPPPTVTGAVGGSVQKTVPVANGPSASLAPSTFYEPSPNARPTVTEATVVGKVGGSSMASNCSVSAEEGMSGISPNVRLCP